MEGSAKTHGAPLPAEEISAMKKDMGAPDKPFYIFPEAQKFFEKKQSVLLAEGEKWNEVFTAWKKKNAAVAKDWDMFVSGKKPLVKWPRYKVGESIATRKANGACITAISDTNEFFVGGSADLEPSNNTKLPNRKSYSAQNRGGQMLHYGVREHAMGGIVNGLVLNGLNAFGATFLVFADYMRYALRLAAIMRIPATYVFTHDSIFVGEDGPTHQPIEQIPSLRMIPNLRVYRPADAQESVVAWKSAYKQNKDPNALIFTRQNLTVFEKPKGWESDAAKGAYIAKNCAGSPDIVLVATGSEVNVALDAVAHLKNKKVRVVSMLCKDLFDVQREDWKKKIVSKKDKVVVLEAAMPAGWDSLRPILSLGIDEFGVCGPAGKLKDYYGLAGDAVAKQIQSAL